MNLALLALVMNGEIASFDIPEHWETRVVLPATDLHVFEVQSLEIRESFSDIEAWLANRSCHEVYLGTSDTYTVVEEVRNYWICVDPEQIVSVEASTNKTLWHQTKLKENASEHQSFAYRWPGTILNTSYSSISLWRYARKIESELGRGTNQVVLRQVATQSYVIAWYEEDSFVVKTAQKKNGKLLTFELEIHQTEIGE
ncbi:MULTISPECIES: hypothetical protein [Gammaproteobacteria]|uniref:hypothetical protein n=1 Tax=Gammaproteobacteria TaxID=1236 RepID=UPI000DD0A87B|nr:MULTISPECIES: hypothetical protein [Gammaproteobacteria]RTE87406.1 hypothetical protein DQX04_03195 [Aliidiomarina sp. B3213]TCZ92808.1 hypothetical protein EYQ95_02110 [Lysobacter sp. N42]